MICEKSLDLAQTQNWHVSENSDPLLKDEKTPQNLILTRQAARSSAPENLNGSFWVKQ